MIISFCGDAEFCKTKEMEETLFSFLEKTIQNERVCFYLRGSCSFDAFAYDVCRKYKSTHPSVRLCYVIPYITEPYLRRILPLTREKYDMVVYPEIEGQPLHLALLCRNRWMAKVSDFSIVYAVHRDGAYKAYLHAKQKGKGAFNLADHKR